MLDKSSHSSLAPLFSPETIPTETRSLVIGPYNQILSGPLQMKLLTDGEMVVQAEFARGYAHRGIEKAMESIQWRAIPFYAGKIDPENAVFGEVAVCLAIEEISGVEIPLRAQAIRCLLMELSRISSHLRYLVGLAESLDFQTLKHFLLRDREKVLDLFELLAGARYGNGFVRPGGVRDDVTDGFIERVNEFCELIPVRVREYNDLFSFNEVFIGRARGLGELTADLCFRSGVTGPNFRASGGNFDLRLARPYSFYNHLDFGGDTSTRVLAGVSDVHERVVERIREIEQSRSLLSQLIERIPSGPHLSDAVGVEVKYTVPPGEAVGEVESPRGHFCAHVVSDGSIKPTRVQFRAPSLGVLQVCPDLVANIRIDDVFLVLASLDIGISEADR